MTQIQFDWTTYLARSDHSYQHNGRTLTVTPAISIGIVLFGVAINLSHSVVSVFLATQLRRGANWARIALTVLNVGPILTLFSSNTPLLDVAVAIGLCVVVVMWLPESNVFFRRMKVERQAHKARQFDPRPQKLKK